MKAGIRELTDSIAITAHGRVAAELVPGGQSPYDRLVSAGVIRPAIESGDPIEGCPDLRLPPGTAKALIDSDRDEA